VHSYVPVVVVPNFHQALTRCRNTRRRPPNGITGRQRDNQSPKQEGQEQAGQTEHDREPLKQSPTAASNWSGHDWRFVYETKSGRRITVDSKDATADVPHVRGQAEEGGCREDHHPRGDEPEPPVHVVS